MSLITPRTSRTAERGFTLVEIIVAIVVLSMVAGAATMVMGSSSRSSQTIKVVDRQQEIVKGVLNRAIANTGWIQQFNCGQGICTAARSGYVTSTNLLLKEDEGTISHKVDFLANGVDTDGDNEVDLYRITVTDTVTAPPTVGTFKPVSVTGNLDMRVRASTGNADVHVCSVSPQVDERLALGMCTRGVAESYDVLKTTTLPWDGPTWTAAKAANAAFVKVQLAPVTNRQVTLTGPTNLPAASRQSTTIKTDATGTAAFRGIKPGQYEMTVAGIPGTKPWKTHSVPSGGYVTITAGETQVASQLEQPDLPGSGNDVKLKVETLDITDPRTPVVKPGAMVAMVVRMIPVPANRATFAKGQNRGWTIINKTDTVVKIEGSSPGLFAGKLLEYPGRTTRDLWSPGNVAPPYVWIQPNGQAYPTTLTLQQRYCNPGLRNTIVKTRCDAFWGPTLWNRYCDINGVHYEPCSPDDSGNGVTDITGSPGA